MKKIFNTILMLLCVAMTASAQSYTFGIGQDDVTATGSKIGMTGSVPETLTCTITSTSIGGSGSARTVMNGTGTVSAVATAATNNRLNGKAPETFDDAFYFAFDVKVADGYLMDITNIAGNLFPEGTRVGKYKLAIYAGSTLLYESQEKSIAGGTVESTAKSVAVSDLETATQEKLKNMSGTISVRMLWWQSGSSSYVALKDLNITATIKMAEGTRYALATTVNPAGAGSVTTDPVGTSFLENATVKMTATPTKWYSFKNWTDDNKAGAEVSTSATYSVTMDAAKAYTANFTENPHSTVTYSLGETGAEGIVPAAVKYVKGETVSVPRNQTIFLAGKTLTGWTDGNNTYAQGKTFQAGSEDVTLTPVFTNNTIDFTQLKSRKVILWQLGRGSGAPALSLQGNKGMLVTQTSVSGVSQDMKMIIDATSGKCNNTSRSDALAQTNAGTKFIVPVIKNAVVTITISNGSSYNLDATTIDGVKPNISANVGTYTYTGETPKEVEILIGDKASYTESISVTYPQTIENEGKGEVVDTKHGFDFVVGVDGDINDAMTAANTKANGNDRYYIFIPDGTYKLVGNATVTTNSGEGYETHIWNAESVEAEVAAVEAETDPNVQVAVADKKFTEEAVNYDNHMTHIKKSNVSIIGQSMDKTILYNVPDIAGISYTSTLEFRSGSDNYIQDFTLKNMYAGGRHDKGVAVAYYDRGTRTIGKNIRMWSNQDTFTTGSTKGYYETCTIAGTVDFICGGDDMWFEECNLIINNRGGNVITAPSTSATAEWGYVFNNCVIDWDKNFHDQTGDKKFNLGRPWKNSPASTYINTKMNIKPSDAGWTKMGSDMVIRFHEYGSVDKNNAPIDLSARNITACSPAPNSHSCVLTEPQAAAYTIDNVFGDYDPTVYTVQADAPVVTADGSAISWADNDYALCWVVFDENDKYVANVTDLTYTLEADGKYYVRAANSRGGLGAKSNLVDFTLTGISETLSAEQQIVAKPVVIIGADGVTIVKDNLRYTVGGAQK